jgi:hypothetical protein
MKIALIISTMLLQMACQTVESISISQIPDTSRRKGEVRSEASSPIILFIPFGTSFIDEAKADLESRCKPPARIEGVVSKHSSTNYFLGLIMSQKVSMSGYCVADKSVSKIKS